MDGEFISEDDLLTFDGWLKYQAIDPAMLTPDELAMWRSYFDEVTRGRANSSKVGLMKLQPVPGEQKYAVVLQNGTDFWLTMWVRCSHKGEIFIMYPRGDRDWDAHASYHLDGNFHQKSYGMISRSVKRQPLTGPFMGSEHLGTYAGHGKNSGAVCEPKVFDGLVIVGPRILGPVHGSVGVDLIEPGYEATWNRNVANRFYFGDVVQREFFSRGARPSVVITIQR